MSGSFQMYPLTFVERSPNEMLRCPRFVFPPPVSLFWGGLTIGRFLAIPLAICFSTASLLWVNLLGGLASSSLLLMAGKVSGVI